MTDRSRVHPHYREMLSIPTPDRAVPPGEAVSATQADLQAMDPGARWAHDSGREAYAGDVQNSAAAAAETGSQSPGFKP